MLEDGKLQVAFIGRSNVGKSSLINALTGQKGLAKTSSSPGRTQLINLFLINRTMYFIDLPGYGFARLSKEARARLEELIHWYFFTSPYKQKYVVLIIDANVGVTSLDIEMLRALEQAKKSIIVVANKVDKIKKAQYDQQLQNVRDAVGNHPIIACTNKGTAGLNALTKQILC